MKLKGVRTTVDYINVEVEPMNALVAIDEIIRANLGIKWGWHLHKDYKTGKYVIEEDDEYYHGSPSSTVVNDDPPQEWIDYLQNYNKIYTELQKAVYKKT